VGKLKGEHYIEQNEARRQVSVGLSPEHHKMLKRVKAYYGLHTNADAIRYLIVARARALEEKRI